MINNALQGGLKSMVTGAAFRIMGGGDQYYGFTGTTRIDFHVAGSGTKIPLINFLHEMGHLLDNMKATENVFSGQVPKNPTWVKDGYVDENILSGIVNEAVQAKPMNEPNMPTEYWADAFANFVATNIDLTQSAGRDMYDFVNGALTPYMGH